MIDPFCTHHSICLNIDFWYSSFAWKWCVFNISAFNWKTLLQFFEKGCFKVKVLKTFKFPLIVTWKHANLSNQGLFWKSLVLFFRRFYALTVVFKIQPLRKSVFQRSSNSVFFQCFSNSSFAVKLAEKSNHSFLLYIHESHFLNICTLNTW